MTFHCECATSIKYTNGVKLLKCPNCGHVEFDQRPEPPRSTTQAFRSAWDQIHSRYGQALASPDTWCESQEREWYDNWKKQTPCGQCKSHWRQLEQEHPVDLSSAEAAFRSLWFMHNEVSRLHSGKPVLTYEEAIDQWKP